MYTVLISVIVVMRSLCADKIVSNNDPVFIEDRINTLLTAQFTGKYYAEILDDIKLLDNNPKIALVCLEKYFDNQDAGIRSAAYGRFVSIASNLDDISVRQGCVNYIVSEIADYLKIDVSNLSMAEFMAGNLLEFCEKDFNDSSKEKLIQILQKASEHTEWQKSLRGMIILSTGVACLEDAKPYLAAMIEEEKDEEGPFTLGGSSWYFSLTWNAMRASARIYQSEDIQRCIKYVDSKGRDDYEKVHNYASELTYLRRSEVVDYYMPFLECDEMIPEPGTGMPLSIGIKALGNIAQMFSPVYDNEQRIWRTEQEAKLGRSLTNAENLAYAKAWLKNPENMKKMRR